MRQQKPNSFQIYREKLLKEHAKMMRDSTKKETAKRPPGRVIHGKRYKAGRDARIDRDMHRAAGKSARGKK